jgi:hypothetical protein
VSQYSKVYSHNPLCCFSTSVHCCCSLLYRLSPDTFGYTFVYSLISRRPNFKSNSSRRPLPLPPVNYLPRQTETGNIVCEESVKRKSTWRRAGHIISGSWKSILLLDDAEASTVSPRGEGSMKVKKSNAVRSWHCDDLHNKRAFNLDEVKFRGLHEKQVTRRWNLGTSSAFRSFCTVEIILKLCR